MESDTWRSLLEIEWMNAIQPVVAKLSLTELYFCIDGNGIFQLELIR